MAEGKAEVETKSLLPTVIQHWAPPAITATFGLVAGMLLAAYNSDLDTNRFFLEKQTKTGDTVAVEFSRYIENWGRLVRLRKEFNIKNTEPSTEEREYFKKVVFERADARDKLFSSLDAAYLYYSDDVVALVVKFREWDNQQSELTIDKLPNMNEWRVWQRDILRQLHKEISK